LRGLGLGGLGGATVSAFEACVTVSLVAAAVESSSTASSIVPAFFLILQKY
jgi:hypothetical protein